MRAMGILRGADYANLGGILEGKSTIHESHLNHFGWINYRLNQLAYTFPLNRISLSCLLATAHFITSVPSTLR